MGIKRAQRECRECAGYVSIIAPIGAMDKVSLVEEEEFPAWLITMPEIGYWLKKGNFRHESMINTFDSIKSSHPF